VTATRKLAAILAADVAGYSRMVGLDEGRTIARLQALRREIIDPTIAKHHGRIFKTTGDGMLVEFASVVDAVRCAVIAFRVGTHVGDVVVMGRICWTMGARKKQVISAIRVLYELGLGVVRALFRGFPFHTTTVGFDADCHVRIVNNAHR
jgi:adenylate cyclase